MIVLNLAFWNLRWRPWRELAFMQSAAGKPNKPNPGDDVRLNKLPSEFLAARGEDLD